MSDSGFEAAPPNEAGLLSFGASCTSASQCASDDCQEFPAKGGMFCTMPCNPGPCPDGCNMMGQCKVP